MRYAAGILILASALVFLPAIFAEDAPPAQPPEQPPAEKPKPAPLTPPRVTFKCVGSFSTTSKAALPTSVATASCMDKDGNLYIALECKKIEGEKPVVLPGGLFVRTAKGATYTYNTSSKPPIPTDNAEHVWKDDATGILYVATGTAGLALIDTKGTPEDQADDTVTVYSMMGVTDYTNGPKDKPDSYSPSIGADNVVYSWMDPDTRDLLICAGGLSTWKGGLTVLVYDKDESAYTKSYTYRAINITLDRSDRKPLQQGVFDTTQCYRPDVELMIGGKMIRKLGNFGENQFCWRAFRDNESGLIYLARRDTYDADIQATPGFNYDGGLTIIDTKKTPDPRDDEATYLHISSNPPLPTTSVMDLRLHKESGDLYVATLDLQSAFPDRFGGLTIIRKDKTAVTYEDKGLFDTSANDTHKLLDAGKALHSAFVLASLKDASGDIFVLEDQGIDVIHKDGFVSRVPLKLFKNLPVMPANNILWAQTGWVDSDGRLYICTADYGTLGVLILEIIPYKPEDAPKEP